MLTRAGRRPTGAPTPPPAAGEWTRARLVTAVAGLAVLAVLLVAGAGLWVFFQVHPPSDRQGPSAGPVATHPGHDVDAPTGGPDAALQARRDRLAAAPMPAADPQAAAPSPLSFTDPGTIDLPAARGVGPAQVPAGFAHTTAGALAQLVAIDTAALNAGSIDHARQVITGWATPGGPTASSWSGVKLLTAIYSGLGLADGSAALTIRATPAMGLVKAADGPDWVVACVDFVVQLTYRHTGQVAMADCQRMTWTGGRWMVGPGAEPANPPSIWPGTDAAAAAGYRTLRQQGSSS